MNKNHFINRIMLISTISGISFLTMNPAIAKEYYKWVDNKGTTHYTTTPPPKSAKKQGKVDTYGWNGSTTTAIQNPAPTPSNQPPQTAPAIPNMDQQQREANAALQNGTVERVTPQ